LIEFFRKWSTAWAPLTPGKLRGRCRRSPQAGGTNPRRNQGRGEQCPLALRGVVPVTVSCNGPTRLPRSLGCRMPRPVISRPKFARTGGRSDTVRAVRLCAGAKRRRKGWPLVDRNMSAGRAGSADDHRQQLGEDVRAGTGILQKSTVQIAEFMPEGTQASSQHSGCSGCARRLSAVSWRRNAPFVLRRRPRHMSTRS
jgi:hypothetical protein